MKKIKIINVVGSRPNFVKIASLVYEMKRYEEIQSILVHTGQHYNEKLSKAFFDDLDIPKPNINLEVGSGSHAHQTAEIMKRFEQTCLDFKPDLVVVVGDVNSTIACALTAVKLGIQVAHVEAGLRSFDKTMPEEINRILTDAISSYLFITEESALQNLKKEGVSEDRIFFVGNLMIETLIRFREKAGQSPILGQLNLTNKQFVLLTLHRPSNVDEANNLLKLLKAIREIGVNVPVLFPAHPRARQKIEGLEIKDSFHSLSEEPMTVNGPGVYLLPPLGYLDFLNLMENAALILTDSGGIQEETTFLGRPCLTLRENTERPVTVNCGTNCLVGLEPRSIIQESLRLLSDNNYKSNQIKFWDDQVARRIVKILLDVQQNPQNAYNCL